MKTDKINNGFMMISLTQDGRITIRDYSQQNDGNKIISCLEELGVETETVLDSPCG